MAVKLVENVVECVLCLLLAGKLLYVVKNKHIHALIKVDEVVHLVVAHSSCVLTFKNASLARNLLSPSVIILNFDWLIIEAGHGTCPAVLTTCYRTQYYEGSNESCYPSIRESRR